MMMSDFFFENAHSRKYGESEVIIIAGREKALCNLCARAR